MRKGTMKARVVFGVQAPHYDQDQTQMVDELVQQMRRLLREVLENPTQLRELVKESLKVHYWPEPLEGENPDAIPAE